MRLIARMNVGGPALQVTGLTKGLDPERFDHRLFAGHVGENEADYVELRAPDLPLSYVPGLGRSVHLASDLSALRKIRLEIARFRPHIVHTHTAKAGVLGRTAAWTSGVPITVHTFHGHLLHGYFSPIVGAGVKAIERVYAARTSHLLAVGAQVREDLLQAGMGRADRFTVMAPGVALAATPERHVARALLDLPENEVVVAFVARLTAVKRPDRLLGVAREVLRYRDDVRFVVVGEGDLLGRLRTDAADLGNRFLFLGWRPDVETAYAAADMTLLTSDNEGMPISLIESSLAGRPAVTTDVGSVREVVLDGSTGRVVPAEVTSLAGAVLELAADPDLRDRFGAAARRWAEQQFSSARLVRDTADLYERLVAEREPWDHRLRS